MAIHVKTPLGQETVSGTFTLFSSFHPILNVCGAPSLDTV